MGILEMIEKGACYRINFINTKRYIEVLVPNSSECDLI